MKVGYPFSPGEQSNLQGCKKALQLTYKTVVYSFIFINFRNIFKCFRSSDPFRNLFFDFNNILCFPQLYLIISSKPLFVAHFHFSQLYDFSRFRRSDQHIYLFIRYISFSPFVRCTFFFRHIKLGRDHRIQSNCHCKKSLSYAEFIFDFYWGKCLSFNR